MSTVLEQIEQAMADIKSVKPESRKRHLVNWFGKYYSIPFTDSEWEFFKSFAMQPIESSGGKGQ